MIPSVTTVSLGPAPIEPSWIREGTPLARIGLLSSSADGMATTVVWDCTAGKFQWIYGMDETIYFLGGSATISCEHSGPRTFTAGDVLFLPQGTVAHWHVETYVRKLAFCRRTQPSIITRARRKISHLKRSLVQRLRSAGQRLNPEIAAVVVACVGC